MIINSYKQFKNLQEAFHNTGQVPRNESNNIWQTYKFHVERYYDFLHLNRDLREADFKHNYAERLKIVERTEPWLNSKMFLRLFGSSNPPPLVEKRSWASRSRTTRRIVEPFSSSNQNHPRQEKRIQQKHR